MKNKFKLLIIISIIAIILTIIIFTVLNLYIKNNNKTIVLNVFHGETCPACLNAIEKMKENLVSIDNLEIRTYEIWNNSENNKLLSKVAEKINYDVKYIPFFLIDSTYFEQYKESQIIDKIQTLMKSKKYNNIIDEILKENSDIKPSYEILK